MSRAGQPIKSHPLREAIDTQIRYESLVPEIASLYEEREAAVFARYNWTEWRSLDWRDRSAAMAHYRTHRLIELHQNDVIAREMDRKAKKTSQGAG